MFSLNTAALNTSPLNGDLAGNLLTGAITAIVPLVELGQNHVIGIPGDVVGEFKINLADITAIMPVVSGDVQNNSSAITAIAGLFAADDIPPPLSVMDITAINALASGRVIFATYGDTNALVANVSGDILNGNVGLSNTTALKPLFTALGGNTLDAVAITSGVDINALNGSVGSFNLNSRFPSVAGDFDPFLSVDTTAIKPSVTGDLLNGGLITFDITAKKPNIDGRILFGNVGTIEASAVIQQASIFVNQQGLLTLDLSGIAHQVLGVIYSDTDTNNQQCYVICTTNMGVTEYTNFTFHSLVNYKGQILGASEEGLFLLSGDDDDGTPINADILTGSSDLDSSNLKRASDLYFYGDLLQGGMEGTFKTSEKTITSQLVRSKISNESYRAKIPKGLRWRKVQLGCSNKTGADFELDGLELLEQKLKRRVL